MQESEIDFDKDETIKGLKNMRDGALCEASRLYEQNYSQFNLPLPVQVATLEEVIHLQSVGYLAKFNDYFFEEQEIDELITYLENVFMLNKTFEELYNFIYEVQKKETSSPFYFQKASSTIKNNLYSLIGQGVLESHQKRLKLIQKIQEMAENTLKFSEFHELKKDYDAGTLSYEKLLNTASYVLYQKNEKCKLYRTKEQRLRFFRKTKVKKHSRINSKKKYS